MWPKESKKEKQKELVNIHHRIVEISFNLGKKYNVNLGHLLEKMM